ncbi:MAG: C25 family cysteine peptidase [Fibrobacterota bacterium]
MRHFLGLFLSVCIVTPFAAPPRVTVLKDGADAFSFEVVFDDPVMTQEGPFTVVSVDGVLQTPPSGAPSVPLIQYLVGMPSGTPKVTWSAAGTRSYTLPTPLRPVFLGDPGSRPDAYSMDSASYRLPAVPSGHVLWGSGSVANQRVLQLHMSPLQYQPLTGQLLFAKKLWATVTFSGTGRAVSAGRFESVLRNTLLNYKTACAFRDAAPLARTRALQDSTPFRFNRLYKIKVRNNDEFQADAEGLYRITGADLAAAGDPLVGVDVDDVRLYGVRSLVLRQPYTEGDEDSAEFTELPIAVTDHNGNHTFDAGDDIRFYGQGASRFAPSDSGFVFHNHPFDFNNYYWLALDANTSAPPRRLDTLSNGTSARSRRLTAFTERVHRESNRDNPTIYDGVLKKHFKVLWAWCGLSSLADPFREPLDPYIKDMAGSAGRILVQTMRADRTDNISYPYSLAVRLNRSTLGKPDDFTFTYTGLRGVGDTVEIGTLDGVGSHYLNWYEVEYPRKLAARNNALLFYGLPGTDTLFEYALTGFTPGDTLLCLDVSDPLRPAVARTLFSNDTLLLQRTGFPYGLDTLQGRRFCAASAAGFRRPASIVRHTRPAMASVLRDLHDPAPRADYLVITPALFYDAARRLALHRAQFASDAVSAPKIVLMEDLYDQYSGGKMDITALRNFLFFASKKWGVSYVVLMGNGHRDFKGYIGVQDPNYIPPYETFAASEGPLIYSPMLRSNGGATDDFYAGTPSSFKLMVGRLPVSNTSEALAVVDKIIRFETDSLDNRIWRNRVLFLADDDWQLSGIDVVNSNFSTQHMNVCERMAAVLPPAVEKVKVYMQEFPVNSVSREKPEAEAALVDAVNRGALLWTFVGHGGFNKLTDEQVFTLEKSFPRFKNAGKCGMFWAASCNVGEFDNLNEESICIKLLTAADVGMTATVGASRESFGGDNADFLNKFFRVQFSHPNDPPVPLGEAMVAARLYRTVLDTVHSGTINDNSRVYNLFGDPAMYLYPAFGRITVDSTALYDTLSMLQKLRITGRLEEGGAVPSAKLSVRLIGPDLPVSVKYDRGVGSTIVSDAITILRPGTVLLSNVAEVRDGRFSLDCRVPKSVPFFTAGSRLSFFAWYGGREAQEGLGNIYFSGAIPAGIDSLCDGNGPSIILYVNGARNSGLEFESAPAGESFSLNRKSVLTVLMEDPDGIRTVGSTVNEGLFYEMPGLFDRRRVESVTEVDGHPEQRYFNLIMDNELLGVSQSLKGKEYDFVVIAQDNFDNSTRRVYKARFADDTEAGLSREEIYNYPNPFRGKTRFIWETTDPCNVAIKIFTQSGRLIRVLQSRDVRGTYAAGAQSEWDGLDEAGNPVARGVYFYQMSFSRIGTVSGTEAALPGEKPFLGKMMKF